MAVLQPAQVTYASSLATSRAETCLKNTSTYSNLAYHFVDTTKWRPRVHCDPSFCMAANCVRSRTQDVLVSFWSHEVWKECNLEPRGERLRGMTRVQSVGTPHHHVCTLHYVFSHAGCELWHSVNTSDIGHVQTKDLVWGKQRRRPSMVRGQSVL